MSHTRTYRYRIDHIIEHLRRILAYTQDGREAFLSSLLVQDAVIRNFEIIGEAAKRISEERRAAAPEIPLVRQQRGVVINRVITILLACSCLALVGWCGVSEYTAHTMSGYQAMLRLAGITDGSVTSERLRLALLERVPVGTSQDATVAFLETHDVPADRFVGGQFVRYQTGHQYILVLFSSPPWVIELFCSQYHSGVRFIFDGHGDLEDIIVENYASCL